MNNVYILGGLRTPIGKTNGILKDVLTEDLASNLIKEAIKRYNLKNKIEEVILGNAVGPGGNISRLASLKAGLNVPAFTIDMQCGSSLAAIEVGYSKIKAGLSDLIIVGGVESTSMEPIKGYSKNHPRYLKDNNIYKVAQFSPEDYNEKAMLNGAERVIEKYKITKEELDFWIKESHKRARKAREDKVLKDIIIPCNESLEDEGIRKDISDRFISKLKPLVKKAGKVNAGNACLTNDAGAILVLCSEKYLKDNNLKDKYKIKSIVKTSGNPDYSPVEGINAVEKILSESNLKEEDINAIEINEAFAAIDVLYQRKFKNIDKFNILGGALAYGHPYGASGAIVTIHLLKALELVEGRLGIVAIPSAGAIGSAMLVEREVI